MKFHIILFLFSVVVVSGCVQPQNIVKVFSQNDPCLISNSTFEKDFCYYYAAESSKNIQLCDKMSSEMQKTYCYTNVAKKTNNEKICERLGENGSIRSFENGVENIISLSSKYDCYSELGLCEKITGSKDDCYYKKGECDKINDTSDRDECYSYRSNDTDSCYKSTKMSKCFAYYGYSNNDQSVCDKLNVTEKDKCVGIIGGYTGNDNLCENAENKTLCYTTLINNINYGGSFSKLSDNICDKIPEIFETCYDDYCYNSIPRDTCYANLASGKRNILLCEKINNSYDIHRCYSRFSSEDCSKFTDANKTNTCIIDIAYESLDSDACKKINDIEYRDKCFSQLAGVWSNTRPLQWNLDTCTMLSTQTKTDKCYSTLFSENFTVSDRSEDVVLVCSKIQNQTMKDECFFYASENYYIDKPVCSYIENSDLKQKCTISKSP